MVFLPWWRPEHLGRGAELIVRRFTIRLSHLRREADHSGGKADVIRAWGALFVEFWWLGLRIEGARGQFNDAGPNGHIRIIAAAAFPRHPVATVMKPQTPDGVYRS